VGVKTSNELGKLFKDLKLYFMLFHAVFSAISRSRVLSVKSRPATRGGAFDAFAPTPKISNHCIEILTFAETFKE